MQQSFWKMAVDDVFCGVIWNEEDKTRMEKNHHHNSKVVRKRLSIFCHFVLPSHTDEFPLVFPQLLLKLFYCWYFFVSCTWQWLFGISFFLAPFIKKFMMSSMEIDRIGAVYVLFSAVIIVSITSCCRFMAHTWSEMQSSSIQESLFLFQFIIQTFYLQELSRSCELKFPFWIISWICIEVLINFYKNNY
jgi:hypothetical protein